MRGICISFNPRDVHTIRPEQTDAEAPRYAVPPGERPFAFFFRPLFPKLDQLYWFASGFQSTPFVDLIYEEGHEERLTAAQMDIGLEKVSCILHRPGTLPALASYLRNDWIDLIGIRSTEREAIDSARKLARSALSTRENFEQWVEDSAEMAFFCVDGFWWEFYAKDARLLEDVVAPLERIAGIQIRRCNLRHRAALFEHPPG